MSSLRLCLHLALLFPWATLICCVSVEASETENQLTFTQDDQGVSIYVDGELFTRYLVRSGTKPVLFPLVGPTGRQMTRSYPVGTAQPGEQRDHPHHRSMWIGYEGINGIDFWHEPQPGVTRAFRTGAIAHRKFVRVESVANTALVITENDWLDERGKRVCTDSRRFQFGSGADFRWVDCLVHLRATEEPLRIADSKEGFFALRVAHPLTVDAKQGGRFVSSTGLVNGKAWAQPAAWVDYSGLLEGQTVGVAVLCHPHSFVPRPRWHVREYGLFAANPFGDLAFTDPQTDVTERPLTLTLAKNESLSFRFRVILHLGDASTGSISERFREFAATPFSPAAER